MANNHPLFVNVLYAHDWQPVKDYQARAAEARASKLDVFSEAWRKVAGWPWVAVSPRTYEPGEVDWRCVAGTWVELHDPDGNLGTARPEPVEISPGVISRPLFFPLLAEIARWAAKVSVVSPVSLGVNTADSLAWLCGTWDNNLKRRRWPSWWSDELDQGHANRFEGWRREADRFYAARWAA